MVGKTAFFLISLYPIVKTSHSNERTLDQNPEGGEIVSPGTSGAQHSGSSGYRRSQIGMYLACLGTEEMAACG